METKHGNTDHVGMESHEAARPMKVVVADDGCTWLCDTEVNENGNLEDQGCWRCEDLAFTRND